MRKELQAITFDVGHTLIFPEPSLGELYAECSRTNGLEITATEAEVRFLAAWRRVQSSHAGLVYGTTHEDALAFWLRVIEEIFPETHATDRQRRAVCNELYTTFSRAHAWRIDPAWPHLLDACRGAGYRIGLVSNWDIRLRGLLAELELIEAVDAIVISAEAGHEKPAPEIFHCALRELQVAAAFTAHVGDTWRDDVEGAAAVGSHPVWLNPRGATPPSDGIDFTSVTSLTEITSLLTGT
jgi:putative hydrolase of the HAD superfamily